jgi:PIN domain nuclease of toxin-antitoxin system
MKLLLDSHVLLWAIDKPKLLSKRVKKALLDDANELHASVASMWEIALKARAGKLHLPAAPGYLEEHLRELGIQKYLAIGVFHVRQLEKLPPIHRDPFDRMLVAQAMAERLTLVSKDELLRKYPIPVLW